MKEYFKDLPKYFVNFVFVGTSELKIPENWHVISSNVEKSPWRSRLPQGGFSTALEATCP